MRSTRPCQPERSEEWCLDPKWVEHAVGHPLALELERHLVDRVDVARRDHRLTGRFANSAIFSRMSLPSASSERHMTMSGWMPIRRSSWTECWVGLVFSSPAWPRNGTSVRWTNMQRSRPEVGLELAQRLEERQRLDVADRAADLGDDDVHVRGLGDQLDPVLDLVGDVRDHLDGAAQVVARRSRRMTEL